MQKDNLSFYENQQKHSSVSIVGVPIELGSDERGLAAAPQHILKHGLEQLIEDVGAEVATVEMIPCKAPKGVAIGKAKYIEEIAEVAHKSAAAVQKAAQKGDTVVALGGDHSMAIGTIAGAAMTHLNLGVIWIDAHPDVNTHETSESGNVHGMTAAASMGISHELITSIGKRGQKVAPSKVLYIGLKDIDAAEIELMRTHSIKSVTMLDIVERGLSRAILAIDALCRKTDAIWVSMDLDSIDQAYAPGVGLPNFDGLTRREALALAQYIGRCCNVVGMDLVEMSPRKDKEGKTVQLALDLIARFLGFERSWYKGYMNDYRQRNRELMYSEESPRRATSRE